MDCGLFSNLNFRSFPRVKSQAFSGCSQLRASRPFDATCPNSAPGPLLPVFPGSCSSPFLRKFRNGFWAFLNKGLRHVRANRFVELAALERMIEENRLLRQTWWGRPSPAQSRLERMMQENPLLRAGSTPNWRCGCTQWWTVTSHPGWWDARLRVPTWRSRTVSAGTWSERSGPICPVCARSFRPGAFPALAYHIGPPTRTSHTSKGSPACRSLASEAQR